MDQLQNNGQNSASVGGNGHKWLGSDQEWLEDAHA